MLIVVEGCVGVGKSTIAKGLAEQRSSGLLLENFEANPFLRPFTLILLKTQSRLSSPFYYFISTN